MIQRYFEQELVIYVVFFFLEIKKNIRDVVILLCDDIFEVEYVLKVLELLKIVINIMCVEYLFIVFLIYLMKVVILENMVENVQDLNFVREVK